MSCPWEEARRVVQERRAECLHAFAAAMAPISAMADACSWCLGTGEETVAVRQCHSSYKRKKPCGWCDATGDKTKGKFAKLVFDVKALELLNDLS